MHDSARLCILCEYFATNLVEEGVEEPHRRFLVLEALVVDERDHRRDDGRRNTGEYESVTSNLESCLLATLHSPGPANELLIPVVHHGYVVRARMGCKVGIRPTLLVVVLLPLVAILLQVLCDSFVLPLRAVEIF